MERESTSNFKKKKKKLAGVKNELKNMSKEAIQAAILKKKKCNDRAIQIVNLLIEPAVTEENLLSCLFDINKSHFDDIVEERAISKMCGYPLCSKELIDVPMKKFHISTKTNKVYDITERKNFCSNHCYKAGKYVKDQLYTSPLWLREHEDPVVYKLLPHTVNCGSSGEEVDFGKSRLTLDEALNVSTISNTVIDSSQEEPKIENISISETLVEEFIKEEMVCDNLQTSVCELNTFANTTIIPDSSCDISSKLESMDISDSVEQKSDIKFIRENVMDDKPVKKSCKASQRKPSKFRQERSSKKPPSPKDIMIKIENVMRSWFTFETFCFLLGEEKVRQDLDSLGLKLQREKTDPYLYDRYTDLCKRLNLLELEENHGAKELESPKKPLPDFDKLKQESKQLEIKVKSFFKGSLEYQAEDAREISSDDPLPVLPPLDQFATKSARRRIFLQKLSVALPDIQEALGLKITNVSHHINEFSTTLNLTAQNISMKPTEWNIVAIVIIKLLSLRDLQLKDSLKSKKASNYLELILMSYTLDSGYLDRLICWLTDLNYLVTSDQS